MGWWNIKLDRSLPLDDFIEAPKQFWTLPVDFPNVSQKILSKPVWESFFLTDLILTYREFVSRRGLLSGQNLEL